MNVFLDFLKVLVFGLVEGFTEWLPISSTWHLILVENIVHLDVSENFMNVFRVVIQLGAILAVLVLYFRRLNPFDPKKKEPQRRATGICGSRSSSLVFRRRWWAFFWTRF